MTKLKGETLMGSNVSQYTVGMSTCILNRSTESNKTSLTSLPFDNKGNLPQSLWYWQSKMTNSKTYSINFLQKFIQDPIRLMELTGCNGCRPYWIYGGGHYDMLSQLLQLFLDCWAHWQDFPTLKNKKSTYYFYITLHFKLLSKTNILQFQQYLNVQH